MCNLLAVGFREHLGTALERLVPGAIDDLRICEMPNLDHALVVLEAGEVFDLAIACLDSHDLITLASVQQLREKYRHMMVLAMFDVSSDVANARLVIGNVLDKLRPPPSQPPLSGADEQQVSTDPSEEAGALEGHDPAALDDEHTRRASSKYHLTPRQIDVLKLMMEGKSNKQIASRLGLSEGTVKVHCMAIFRELGVMNRTQAAIAAERIQVIPS